MIALALIGLVVALCLGYAIFLVSRRRGQHDLLGFKQHSLRRSGYALRVGFTLFCFAVALRVMLYLTFPKLRQRWFHILERDWYTSPWPPTLWIPVATITALALAYLYFLSVKRLRDADMPNALALLAFIPGANLVFFSVLSLVPSRMWTGDEPAEGTSWVPHSTVGSAAWGVMLTAPLAVLLTYFGTNLFSHYSWTLFAAVPMLMGFLSVAIFGWHRARPLAQCLWVSVLTILLVSFALLIFAIEGLICILLAAPIEMPFALLGGYMAYLWQHRPHLQRNAAVLAILILLIPILMGIDRQIFSSPEEHTVVSALEIEASPEAIWPYVSNLSGLPAPKEAMFRAGVAYPVGTLTYGGNVGAKRLCRLSNGDIVERIDEWILNRKLRFAVSSQPPMMEELTLYDHINVAHVDLHYVRSTQGQIELIPLANGRTLVRGTSWYTSRLWPAFYWRFWTDSVVRSVHRRVFQQIKAQAEARQIQRAQAVSRSPGPTVRDRPERSQ